MKEIYMKLTDEHQKRLLIKILIFPTRFDASLLQQQKRHIGVRRDEKKIPLK